MIKLIIADDHQLFVDGLRALLDEMDDVDIMATAGDGHQLLDYLRTLHPDLVLMDLNMPGLDGIETLKILEKDFPKINVIILTSYYQPELLREIKSYGAKGYVLKSSSILKVKEAIISVSAGNLWFDENVTQEQSDSPFFIDDFMKKYQLTRREVEVIKMVATGLTSKEIAEQLFISEFTVNAHRRNISRKLDIHSPVGLLNFVKDQGLI